MYNYNKFNIKYRSALFFVKTNLYKYKYDHLEYFYIFFELLLTYLSFCMKVLGNVIKSKSDNRIYKAIKLQN